MSRLCWWLLDVVSRMLEPHERDAVRGDLAESGATSGRALRDVLGLVVRRQAALWTDWRPWLALVGIVGPVGMLLSYASRWWADGSAIYAFLYINDWTSVYLENPGARHDLVRLGTGFLLNCLTLIGWSWTGGYVLGSISRRSLWVTATLFCLVVLVGTVGTTTTARGHNTAFSLTFYAVVFPRLLRTLLVLLPALMGMHRSLRRPSLPLLPTIAGAVAMALLTAWAARGLEGSVVFGRVGQSATVLDPGLDGFVGTADDPRPLWPLSLVMVWPTAYIVATTSWQRWRKRREQVWPRAWLFGIGAVLIGSAAVVAAQDASLDYPQWRGRNSDGAASAFVEPKSWPEKLTLRWKVEVGEGYATPIVVGNTVYAFTRQGDSEVMLALDAGTGAERWRSSYPAPYSPSEPTKAHGSGPKATPLFHEGKLYTLGVSGIVAAFDASIGKLLWRTPAPAEHPYFSAASSPIGDKGLAIVHPGNYGPLTAFDTMTGTVRWTAGDGGFFASPIIVTLSGARQVVSATQKGVIGVSAVDGALLWQYSWPAGSGGSGGTTPVLHGETIIVSAPDVGVAAIRPTKHDGKWATDTLWATKEISMYMSNPVTIGDTLFGLSTRASGQFFALDALTGKVLWLGQPREATNTAVVKSGDLLFLLNDDAELIVARSSRTGFEPLKRYTVADSATWAQPAISGNRLFIKDVSSLALWTVD